MDKPKCWVKNAIKKCTVEVGLNLKLHFFLTQHLGLSIFHPNLGSNNSAFLECMDCVIFLIIQQPSINYSLFKEHTGLESSGITK